ncbi:MAG TPA: NAD(+) synthase [Gemmatimonadaceae bacterium]|nr:NAD(+) synthase [Gemmatimonadaceae bacterium]
MSNPWVDALSLDPADTTARLTASLSDIVLHRLRKRGAVVGLSGGVDSSVVAALCARAFGPRRVLGLLMPERESDGDSLALGRQVAEHFGITSIVEDVTPILDGAGCYQRRDAAIRRLIPAFGPGWRSKVALPSLLEGSRYRIFSVVAQAPTGERVTARVTPEAYLELVAATNFKQRARKMVEYFHADRLNYAVIGTPNRLEYDQGFFVKNGDGAADVKPIAHLYKTQVYQLAEYLGVPEAIRGRPPTTDTYSLPQTQEEFYFSLPYAQMDACLYARNSGVPADEVARALGLRVEQVERVFQDIDDKRRATRPLHLPPQLVTEVSEIHA